MANIKIPNPKSQIPNKFQLPKSQNKSNYLYFFVSAIGILVLVWYLEIVIWHLYHYGNFLLN